MENTFQTSTQRMKTGAKKYVHLPGTPIVGIGHLIELITTVHCGSFQLASVQHQAVQKNPRLYNFQVNNIIMYRILILGQYHCNDMLGYFNHHLFAACNNHFDCPGGSACINGSCTGKSFCYLTLFELKNGDVYDLSIITLELTIDSHNHR